MPGLSCDASNCVHNKNNCCCISNIKVCGKNAKNSNKTNCDNFCMPENPEALNCNNGHETACMCLSIDCEAENCVHNQNKVCNAERVDISGCDAQKAKQTECFSFRDK